LGNYDGNTVLIASVDVFQVDVAYNDNRDSLVYSANSVNYPFTRSIRSTTSLQFQLGIAISSLEDPLYRVASANGGTRVVREDTHGFFAAATFVNFLWCAQDLSSTVYVRRCASGKRLPVFLPSVALGVPITDQLFRGNGFLGLSFPYIPYLSVVAGIHVGNVRRISAEAFTTPNVVDVSPFIQNEVHASPFLALNMNSDIFYALFPSSKPAQ
jgi:hypothetical protein